MKDLLRLNRFLATAGVASRRRCDDLIRQGRIAVNGIPIQELGTRVDPSGDEVSLDGVRVELPSGQWTLVLNKPRDVLVAASDTRGRRTVMDLLVDAPGRVFPVGRLDYRSEGLLLFTNDGDLAYRLAHPRFKVEKVYDVEVEGAVARADIEKLRQGVILEDGPTRPAQVEFVRKRKTRSVVRIELREGRKRQVRRMMAMVGYDIVRLRRVSFGPLNLGALDPGRWRELSAAEVRQLRTAVGMDGESPS